MPIYEYKCDGCNEIFEVFQKVSDPPPAQHTCGSGAVHRVLSNTSFVLKGSGWYITDYARKDNGGGSGSGSGKSKKDTEGGSGNTSGSGSGNTSESGSGESKSTSTDSKSGSKASGGVAAA